MHCPPLQDKTVAVWDLRPLGQPAAGGAPKVPGRTIGRHNAPVRALVWLPDDSGSGGGISHSRLLSGTDSPGLVVWRVSRW